MNRWLLLGAVGVGLLLPAPGRAGEPARGGAKAMWHSDYEKARAAARESGRPMFLVFRCVP